MEPCQQCSSAVPCPKASGLSLGCACCTVRAALGTHTPSSSATRSCSPQSSEPSSAPAAAVAAIPVTVTRSAAAISRSVLWGGRYNVVSHPVWRGRLEDTTCLGTYAYQPSGHTAQATRAERHISLKKPCIGSSCLYSPSCREQVFSEVWPGCAQRSSRSTCRTDRAELCPHDPPFGGCHSAVPRYHRRHPNGRRQ
jgi:hypothetical protein